MGRDLELALGLEVEALSRPALYVKELLVPEGMGVTVVPLEAVWRTGSYKDWVMLEMPKCGCVNIHLSRSMPARGKALNAADQMPLFRSIPRFDQSGPETPPSDRSLSSKTTEIALSASAAGLIPADFQAFCRYAFILGLHLESNGCLELEDMCYSCACMHPACIDINRSTGSELARLRGNIQPKWTYCTPSLPPYPCLPRLCFPTGLQVCFHSTPPDRRCFTQVLGEGLRCYGCVFYAAVSGGDLGLQQVRTVFVPTVLGLVSQVRDAGLMMTIAETIVSTQVLNSDGLTLRSAPLHQDSLLRLTQEIPLPTAPSQALRFSIQGCDFQYRPLNSFSLAGFGSVLDVRPETVINVLNELLLERKVLLVSASEAKLSLLVPFFAELLYPLDWPHPLVPLLPLSMLDVLSAPRPMLVGLHEYHLSTLAAYFPEVGRDTTLIRLDSTPSLHPSIDLPNSILTTLYSDLKAAEGAEGRVREAVTRAVGGVLAGYQDHLACSNGVNYLHSAAFLRTVPAGNRAFVEKFIGTSVALVFLQRHASREKYAFHRLAVQDSLPPHSPDYTTYVVPALPDTLPTTSSSGSYYQDVLPSPRRPPNFNTSLDFSYSASEEEEEVKEVSFRPIGLPCCEDRPARCCPLPEAGADWVPKDLELILPQRISGFCTAAAPAAGRLVSSAQSLISRLLTVDPPPSVCGQLLRLLLTSNLEPCELHHLCTALRPAPTRFLFLSALQALTQGRIFELRYRAYLYLSQLFNSLTVDCTLSGHYDSALLALQLSDRLYYVTPRDSREYLIEEMAGCGLWGWVEFWRTGVQQETAFQDILKAAGLMVKLDVEIRVARKVLVRLAGSLGLDLEQEEMLVVLVEKLYKARMSELEED